jgi:hypothetical protein
MKQIIRGLLSIGLLIAPFAAPAGAEEIKAGDLVISQGWSRATPGGAKIGGGYLTMENKGATADRLIHSSGDIAGKIEVHEMAMKNGVMTCARSTTVSRSSPAARQARAGPRFGTKLSWRCCHRKSSVDSSRVARDKLTQRHWSGAVFCPACCCSQLRLLALMESANKVPFC